jgi:hypothetical protein
MRASIFSLIAVLSVESAEPVVAAPSAEENATIQELVKRLGL